MERGEPTIFEQTRRGMNLLEHLINGWAITVYLPFRSNTGKEFLAVPGLIGFVWVFVFCALVENSAPLIVLPIFLFSLICHRIGHLRQRLRRQVVHRFYCGEPWLAMRVFGCKNEQSAKALPEFLLAVVCAFWGYFIHPTVFLYYFGGSFMVMFSAFIAGGHEQARIDEMNDAMIEANYFRGQYYSNGRR